MQRRGRKAGVPFAPATNVAAKVPAKKRPHVLKKEPKGKSRRPRSRKRRACRRTIDDRRPVIERIVDLGEAANAFDVQLVQTSLQQLGGRGSVQNACGAVSPRQDRQDTTLKDAAQTATQMLNATRARRAPLVRMKPVFTKNTSTSYQGARFF